MVGHTLMRAAGLACSDLAGYALWRSPFMMISLRLICCAAAVFGSCAFASNSERPITPAESVVIIATRMPQAVGGLPVSADTLDEELIRQGGWRVNLSESLGPVPGIVAQNRQNYAQDLQISSRGFGARSTFGVRGLRLYSDGIPATMPDGQGQVSHFDLGSAARIEVMRGPFSTLYGNSSGGVIAVFTEDGKPEAAFDTDFFAGDHGTQRGALKFSGDTGQFNYVAGAAHFKTDGFRKHSSVQRDTLNAKFRTLVSDGTDVTLIANSVEMAKAEDPLGLTRAQYEADPRQAGTGALSFDTRKSVRQQQLGLILHKALNASSEINAEFYGGQRASRQFQSIPVATQLSAANPGGVIDLKRSYWGGDMRWTSRGTLLSTPTSLVLGLNYESMAEQRKGFQNFVGTTLGVLGSLRRNEDNGVQNFDQYLQWQWQPADKWLLQAGLRHSLLRVRSQDRYVVPGNGDDSGSVEYSATTPVAGASWKLAENAHLYAAAGRGFETPTLNELSYRSISGTTTGLNLGLRPSRSNHYEVGVKLAPMAGASINAALFRVNTRDELVVQQNAGGRSVFQNVGSTRRHGLELSYAQQWTKAWSTTLAYSRLDAVYATDFLSCSASPCTVPVFRVPAGSRMPGIPRSSLYAEFAWKPAPEGMSAALEVRSAGKVFVDDANSDAAEAYTVANLRLELEQKISDWRLREFFRADNLTDRRYAGSVIVNESNRRYFEPAPGRALTLGVSLHTAW